MKILFDPQVFQLGYSGMQRYYSVLYSGLVDAGIEIVYPKRSPFSHDPAKKPLLEKKIHPRLNQVLRKLKFKKKRQDFFHALDHTDYDLVYLTSPAFESEFLNHIQEKPFVMTVHDTMQIIHGPHMLIDQPRDTMALGYLAERAERVACVSDHTKQDLCNKYMVDPAKTQTVYLANFLSSEPAEIPNLPERFILNVGPRTGRKNFFEWMKAVSPSLKDQTDTFILVTGELTQYEKYFYEKLGVMKNIIPLEDISDAQLVTLYQNAMGLVYPTLYEGFGLPVVEAMANGCPVITSDCTSIPEVAGSAALYIDPTDSENMLTTFKKFMESPILRKVLSEKGLKQSKEFSKEKFVSDMVDLFETAIRNYNK